MIINVIVEMVNILLQGVFGILPNIPEMPTAIVTALETMRDFVIWGFKMIVYIFGGAYLTVVLPVLVIIINFKYIYQLIMWIVRKLPIGAQ